MYICIALGTATRPPKNRQGMGYSKPCACSDNLYKTLISLHTYYTEEGSRYDLAYTRL